MLPIGVMVNNLEPNRLRAFDVAADLGFDTVHTSALPESWLTGAQRDQYVEAARASRVQIATVFIGFDGQSYASFDSIRETVGLLNPLTRRHRLGIASLYADLATDLNAPSLAAHIGFIPETKADPLYAPLVNAVQQVADMAADRGLTLHLETGQESAAVLRHFLHDVERANLGVNFDPANFLLYGTDDPVVALGFLLPWVKGVHCKDGEWPERAGVLGRERPLGQGDVPLRKLVAELVRSGYRGALVIERESGPQAVADILAARDLIRIILAELHTERV